VVILTHLKRLNWAEYGAELIGTAILLLVGLSAAVFNFGEQLPMTQWLPNQSLRLLLTGLMFSGTGSLIAVSPLGQVSGAHLNPSVSLAFWMLGKMHLIDLIGYILSQFVGAFLGAYLLIVFWQDHAVSVDGGMTLAGVTYPLWLVFLFEVFMTAILVFSIFIFLSQYRLMKWTPLMTWLLIATMVWLESPISGTSLNPARSLGPALVLGNWQDQWIYGLAPPSGALLAVLVFHTLKKLEMHNHRILTCKLFHVSGRRNIFKCERPYRQKLN